jgi:ABC-2 type transport system ATP-binding protein
VDGAVHVSSDGRSLKAAVRSGSGLGTKAVRALDQAGISVDDVAVLQPSLDDVFFELTGGPSSDGTGEDDDDRQGDDHRQGDGVLV